MRSKVNKAQKKTSPAKPQRENFFKYLFLNSKYSDYLIPAIYFIIVVFAAMTNRKIGDYGVESDFYWSYAPQAKGLLNGNFVIDPYRGPLYQIVLAGFGFLFGQDFYTAGKFINALFASISLIFIFKTIRSISDSKTALFTLLLVCVNYTFVVYSFQTGTDMLFLALYTSSVYFILKNNYPDHKDLFLSGTFAGFAYLTRYTAISLILASVLIFLFKYFQNKKISGADLREKFLGPILFYLTPVVICVVAWGIFCFYKTGQFFYNLNYQNIAYMVYIPEGMTNAEWNSLYQSEFNSLLDVITANFGMFMYKIFIESFTSFFIKDLHILMQVYIGVFVAAGLLVFLIKFRNHSGLQKYFFLFSFVFYLQIILSFYSDRFSIPLLAFYFFLAVKFFYYGPLQNFNFNFGRVRFFSILLTALITITFFTTYNKASLMINIVPNGIFEMSRYIKNNGKEDLTGKSVMAKRPHIAYYLDIKFEPFPFVKTYDELFQDIKAKNADYLYVNEIEMVGLERNLLSTLLNFKNPANELEVVSYNFNPTGILYKIKK